MAVALAPREAENKGWRRALERPRRPLIWPGSSGMPGGHPDQEICKSEA